MKVSRSSKIILIAQPDFHNPYPNPLVGIPNAMKKLGMAFRLLNPATATFEEYKKQIDDFKADLVFGLMQANGQVAKICEYLRQYHPIPAINWNLEDPNSVLGSGRETNLVELSIDFDAWFGIDKRMLPFWKTKSAFVPQAFDDDIFFDRRIERSYVVSYIGQLGHAGSTKMYLPYMRELSRYRKKALLCIERPMGLPFINQRFEDFLRSSKRRKQLQSLPFWKCAWKNPQDEDEKAKFVNQSKMQFGMNRLSGDWEGELRKYIPEYQVDKNGFYQLKARLFQGVGAGAMMLNEYCPELEELFHVGKEIVTFEFGNIQEVREKLAWYSSHEAERAKIAQAGYERAHREHTFSNRIQQILAKTNELL